jgi:nucleoside-diphosphate-sugar epimerase
MMDWWADEGQGLRAHYHGAQVLVTGGAGAIGSNLTRALVALGSAVVVVDDLSSGFLKNLHPVADRIVFVEGDIVKDEVLAKVFARRFDLVFHLAALFANQNSVEHPEQDLATNGMGTLKLCSRSVESGVGRFVFASSSCVYGGAGGRIAEGAPCAPHTPYAMTKLLGEQYVGFHHRHHGLQTVVLRYFNSFGPGEYPGPYRNVIPNFMARARRGEVLPLTGDGEETRDFTFVADTVRGTLMAGMVPEAAGQTLNLGTGQETRIRDLAVAINEIAGNAAGIRYVERRSWDHIPHRCACVDRAREVLGYKPEVALEEGLAATYRWVQESGCEPGLQPAEQVGCGGRT